MVAMAPPSQADGRRIGWAEDWPPDWQMAAASARWQAPADVTAVITVVAGVVVGVWRARGADVNASGFASYDLVPLDPDPAEPLACFVGTRFPARRGPKRYAL